MVDAARLRYLNTRPLTRGRYVLYWMQAAQRIAYNHALAYAVDQANALRLPVVACFGLTEQFPAANARHYAFLLQGLSQVQRDMRDLGIAFAIQRDDPPAVACRLGQEAALAIVDGGYLRLQRSWREAAARQMACPLVQVETEVVVPVETASPKEEYAARTLRPRLARWLDRFLQPMEITAPVHSAGDLDLPSLDLSAPVETLRSLQVDRSVAPVLWAEGGYRQARQRLDAFIATHLDAYAQRHNDPNAEAVSRLSPYLHFGQISPLEIALAVRQAGGPGAQAFLEELIVRRELSMNMAHYNPHYDAFQCLPDWARRTLQEHAGDRREAVYDREALEQAATHDPYWNAAQQELYHTGTIHGYMRMYWGKKILEWSATPQEAYDTAVYLNDKYALDGRDANGYAGIAWCFGKHDQAWAERPVFGKVRWMSAGGLRRKFDADAYVRRMAALAEKAPPSPATA